MLAKSAVTPKTYLKGAPFYNAWGKAGAISQFFKGTCVPLEIDSRGYPGSWDFGRSSAGHQGVKNTKIAKPPALKGAPDTVSAPFVPLMSYSKMSLASALVT